VPPTKYWKLGLFLVLGLLCFVLALSYFGTQTIGRQSIEYFTYFDESVEGITVGSPVRFRGITIGRVGGIGVAPDRRHVEIRCSLAVKELRRLRLVVEEGAKPRFALQPDMRTELKLIGLTGEQVLSIDYFDPTTHPPPALPFPVPERTIPSTRSMLDRLAEALGAVAERLPGLLDNASKVITEAGALITQISSLDLGGRTEATQRRLDQLLVDARRVVAQITASRLPEELAQTLRTLDGAFEQMNQVLDHVDGERGLVRSAQRATDAMGDVARGSREVGHELDATLREIRQTSATIRRLTDAIDRQPDMLVKGRSRNTP
jgi:phospholipid/cholesterol/gamma-HCH transport system substrate-binding protein